MSKEKEKLIEDNKDKFDQELTLTKIDLLKNSATTFLTGDVFRKPIEFRSDLEQPTAATDGKMIMIDPDCWLNSTRPQHLGIIFHEGYHGLMGHCNFEAKTDDEHLVWNLGIDCHTEAVRVVCGIGEQTELAAIKPSYDGNVRLKINDVNIILPRCHEKTSEELYDMIVAHVKKNPPKGGNGPIKIRDENGKELKPIDGHNLREFTPEEKAEMEKNLRQVLVEHKLKGTLPGYLSSIIDKMLECKVNWKSELRDLISPEIKSYQSFNHISRRGRATGLNLPGMVKEGVEVGFAMDTSGSMGIREIESAAGQAKGIFDQFESGMVKIKMILHHSSVYKVTDMEDPNALKNIKTESGGTSHIGVFETAEEEDVKVLICFTDGYSTFPESTTIRKILWLCTDENGMKNIPDHLGKKIYVSMKEFQED